MESMMCVLLYRHPQQLVYFFAITKVYSDFLRRSLIFLSENWFCLLMQDKPLRSFSTIKVEKGWKLLVFWGSAVLQRILGTWARTISVTTKICSKDVQQRGWSQKFGQSLNRQAETEAHWPSTAIWWVSRSQELSQNGRKWSTIRVCWERHASVARLQSCTVFTENWASMKHWCQDE